MTDKLKCPFCNAELENACAQVIYFCANDECNRAKDWYASKQVWQALIDGKKAQDALEHAKEFIGHGIDSKVANFSDTECKYVLSEIDKIMKQEE